ncbi:hypothetical protein BC830DRAFT_1141561 [Chytriomyces sp. MP71]|nr:hypothetical protein BC830DRAFT_1141561 [Chytriomyces sp. MP71]
MRAAVLVLATVFASLHAAPLQRRQDDDPALTTTDGSDWTGQTTTDPSWEWAATTTDAAPQTTDDGFWGQTTADNSWAQTTDAPAPAPIQTTDAPVQTTDAPAPMQTTQPPPVQAPAPPQTQAPPPVVQAPVQSSSNADPDIQGCINAMNGARAQQGISPLSWSDDIANNHAFPSAYQCALHNIYDYHTDSGPGTIFAQNLYLSKVSCVDAFPGWMASQGHYANIMNSAYTKFGCGATYVNGIPCAACDFTW